MVITVLDSTMLYSGPFSVTHNKSQQVPSLLTDTYLKVQYARILVENENDQQNVKNEQFWC